MINVVVLYGGRSGEHEVSLISASSIVRKLGPAYKLRCIGIDKTGRWHLQPPAVAATARRTGRPLAIEKPGAGAVSVVPGRGLLAAGKKIPADVVFPVLHGTFGEDGTVQGLLEMADLAYVGAGVLGSAIGMDKEKAKRLWQAAGLPIVPYICVVRSGSRGLAGRVRRELGFPVFVKPARLGSSVGLGRALNLAFRYDTKVLVEKAVQAREIECSVLGGAKLRSFTPGEVLPSHAFYDYEAKYLDPNGASFSVPARLKAGQLRRIRRLAEAAFETAGVEGMARVDFFVDKSTGRVYLNELNTIPGFTPISMFPMMCAHDGLAYPELLDELIRAAMLRFEARQSLDYSFETS
jgi:D-alanine-D-alanine ligase